MPNWYTGQATLKGDVYLFRKWYIETVQQNDGNAGDSFAQTFVPLSSGKYNFDNTSDAISLRRHKIMISDLLMIS